MTVLVREKSFYKMLFTLAVPIMLQNLLTFGVGFADNLMVGSLGEYAISAVYIGNQIQMLLQMFIMGILGAMQVISTQYWGKRDTASIKTILAISVKFTIVITLLISAVTMIFPYRILGIFTNDLNVIEEGLRYLRFVGLSYFFFGISQIFIGAMRSVESVKVGMYISIMTLFTDVLLNWVLIFGYMGLPALGVKGAAIATLISRILEAIVIILYIVFKDKKLNIKLKDLRKKDVYLFKDYIRYGLPIIAGQFVWAVNNIFQALIAGRMGAAAMAAISITGMLNSLIFIWIIGLSVAVGIITGKTVGAGEFEKMKLYAKTIQIIFVLIGIFSGLFIFAIRDLFLHLYNISSETYLIGRQMMTVLSVTMVGTTYQGMLLGGLVKAGGDTSFVFINDTIFVFLTIIPSTLLAMYVFHAPVWVVFLCLKSDQLTKCIVAVIKINRFKWMKNLTRQQSMQKCKMPSMS